MQSNKRDVPCGNAAGFVENFRYDIVSGFLVFLIAMPLCLAIARTSGFPPIAGIFTAIVGAVVTTLISNSELTIKGPAAGLIVIVVGCIKDFGGDGAAGGFLPQDMAAYKAALAVGVAAAVIQILFGLFRAGILGEFFPLSAVHGMLAAIGIIIILKQLPVVFGVEVGGEPLHILRELPHKLLEANPAIALIGLVSLAIMFAWPVISRRVAFLKSVPAPLVVLLVAIPMGMAFDLLHKHSYTFAGHSYVLSEDKFLVAMPGKMFGMFDEITTPDFSALQRPLAWKWVFMFFAIGTLESLLSAKAVDIVDPWKRKTNFNRDLVAVGVANLCSSMVGGLPMISEIVRSKANIMNGARTRFANFWHGMFLMACVALVPMFLHRIPLAALAAMLVYTGFRLAHPTEFLNVYRIGREQLIIFVSTIVGVLAIDLLAGIGIGILVKLFIHVMNGVPLQSFFKPFLEVESTGENSCLVSAKHSAVFSNWIPFRRQLEELGYVQRQNITLDLSQTKLVDHSVMEKLHELQLDFESDGLTLEIIGLDALLPVARHELSARRSGLARMKRVTLVVDEERERLLEKELASLNLAGFVSVPCRTLRHSDLTPNSQLDCNAQVRIELLISKESAEAVMTKVRNVLHSTNALVYQELVDVQCTNFGGFSSKNGTDAAKTAKPSLAKIH